MWRLSHLNSMSTIGQLDEAPCRRPLENLQVLILAFQLRKRRAAIFTRFQIENLSIKSWSTTPSLTTIHMKTKRIKRIRWGDVWSSPVQTTKTITIKPKSHQRQCKPPVVSLICSLVSKHQNNPNQVSNAWRKHKKESSLSKN